MSNWLEPTVARGRRPGSLVAAWGSLLAAFASGPLGGCTTRPDPIAAEVDWARERTLPSDGRVDDGSILRRNGQSARAGWRIETRMSWTAYVEWVVPRLGPYRLVERSPERLRLSQELPADVCTLVLAGRAGANGLLIEVAFEAVPF